MGEFITMRGNGADVITGERISPGDRVFDTGKRNLRAPYMSNSRNRVIKEETIVWLAKEAGIKLCGDNCDCKSDERVSEPASVVEREDAGVGDGEAEVGAPKAGGKPAAKRRASGTTKSK